MTPLDLNTESLRQCGRGAEITAVLAAALAAAHPGAAIARHLRRQGDLLLAGGGAYDLAAAERVLLVGAGKAGAAMADAVAGLLGERLADGLVVAKAGPAEAPPAAPAGARYRLLPAGHPLPDARGVAAGAQIAAMLGSAGPRDLVIALISGGGSALLTSPAPGVSLADLRALTGQLLACGARIDEINALRKHLDTLKGGGLARLAAPAPLLTLILSDVVGSPLDVIASGPTVPDPSSFADAWAVLERHALLDTAPAAVLAHLRAGLAGAAPETPKPGDPLFAGVRNLLVGSNIQSAEAAMAAAAAAGFQPLLLSTFVQGEAREAGRLLAALAREVAASGRPISRPACLIVGGETTVTLRGGGRGGRNQELALGALADMAGVERAALVALATDGDDGPTDAAGAVVTGESMARAAALGLDPAAHLARNDAYPFFAALGDLLRPGPTGTNVNDLAFLFLW